MTHSTIHSILILAACPFPAPQGSQVYIGELARALADQGLSVRLLTYPGMPAIDSGVGFRHITTPRSSRPPRIKAGPSWQKVRLDGQLYRLLHREIRSSRPDVIHAQNIEALLIAYPLCRKYNIPLVYGVHGLMARELETYFGSDAMKGVARHAGSWLDRFAAKRANAIHLLEACSLEDWFRISASPRTTAVIPPGVDLKAFDAIPPVAIPSVDFGAMHPLLAYGGNLDDYQDIDLALEAFALIRKNLPSARLILASHRESGRYERISRKCAAIEGASVHELTSFGAMKYLYAQADVLLNPRSLRGGFPIKLLNYMAAGKPIVSCRLSASFLRHEQHAMLVENRDPHEFASAILRVLRDRQFAIHLGLEARGLLEREFAWPVQILRILDLYERARNETQHARNPEPSDCPAR